MRLLAAFAAVYVLWSGTYLAIRFAVAEIPPLLTMAIRCAGSAAVLLAWVVARRQLRASSVAEWACQSLAGVLLFVGCHGLLAWAEQRAPSGSAALYLATIPLWLLAWSAARERRLPPPRVVAGLGLGVAGVWALSSGTVSGGRPLEHLVLLASGLFWAAGSVVGRDGRRPASSSQATAMQLAAGAVALFGAAASTGELGRWDPATLSLRAGLAVGFLVLGMVFGFGAYTWLLRVASPAAAGSYAYVNPVLALVLASVVGDQKVGWRTAVAAALVLGAVVLTQGAGTAPINDHLPPWRERSAR
jgi:drug/metabolite transporter (DMT)-like permease